MQQDTDHARIKRPFKVRMVLDNSVQRQIYKAETTANLSFVDPGTTEDNARSVLAEMTEVFDSLGVCHYICDGTLLGFVREGGFIAGDNDIDVRFDRHAPWDDLIAAFETAGFTFIYRSWIKGQDNNMGMFKQGLFLDLLGTDFSNGSAASSIAKYPACYLTYRVPFDGVERRDFDGLSLSVPRNPEREVAACYGPNWREPAVHWHHHFSHQALYQCTGRLRNLLSCAFNLQEGQRCLNGGSFLTRPWNVREMLGVARSMASVRPLTEENRFF